MKTNQRISFSCTKCGWKTTRPEKEARDVDDYLCVLCLQNPDPIFSSLVDSNGKTRKEKTVRFKELTPPVISPEDFDKRLEDLIRRDGDFYEVVELMEEVLFSLGYQSGISLVRGISRK